jgi:hypothetical protein
MGQNSCVENRPLIAKHLFCQHPYGTHGTNEYESSRGIVGSVGNGRALVAAILAPLQSEEIHTASTLRLSGPQTLSEVSVKKRGLPLAYRRTLLSAETS